MLDWRRGEGAKAAWDPGGLKPAGPLPSNEVAGGGELMTYRWPSKTNSSFLVSFMTFSQR